MAELSRDDAWLLVTEWVESDSLRKHLLGVDQDEHIALIIEALAERSDELRLGPRETAEPEG